MRGFHRDSLDAFREDAVAIALVLSGEKLVARHAHGPRSDPVGFEFFLGIQNEPDLGSAGDQYYVRRPAWRIGQDVSAASQPARRGIF